MVLAEKSAEVRNGKSRGPSPNGHGSPDSSSENEDAEKIRVGRDYQAVCPELEPIEKRRPDMLAERALLVWSPTTDIPDEKLDNYITVAKDKYGYNAEQALGMLFWHKHDLNRASLDLANFTPFPDDWTVEDKVLFEQAFQFHGKSFHRIRHMLPDKPVASLVKYYYSWKKTRARTSVMDVVSDNRGAAGTSASAAGGGGGGKRDSAANSEKDGSDKEASDTEEKKWTIHRGIVRDNSPAALREPRVAADAGAGAPPASAQGEGGGEQGCWCTVCGIPCTHTTAHNSHKLCRACLVHARRTGTMRPLCGPSGRRGPGGKQQRYKHRLPQGIYINHDDLVAMATGPQPGDAPQPGIVNQGETMLKSMDREIVSLRRQVQENKQQLSSLKRKIGSGGADLPRPGEPVAKINSRWNSDELLMAVAAVKKYGKDYNAIAEIIGTKTEVHVRTFFISYRRRYNLDAILKEFEAERGNTSNPEGSEAADSTRSTNGDSNGEAVLVQDSVDEEKSEVDSEAASLGASAEEGAAVPAAPPAAPPAPALASAPVALAPLPAGVPAVLPPLVPAPGPSHPKPRAAN